MACVENEISRIHLLNIKDVTDIRLTNEGKYAHNILEKVIGRFIECRYYLMIHLNIYRM